MTICRRDQITVADILAAHRLGLVRDDTVLLIPTTWAPVAVEELATNATLDQSQDVLYICAPVEQHLEAWSHGHHGGNVPMVPEQKPSGSLGPEMAGVVGEQLSAHVEDAHKHQRPPGEHRYEVEE